MNDIVDRLLGNKEPEASNPEASTSTLEALANVEPEAVETKKAPDFPPSVLPQKGLKGGYTIVREMRKEKPCYRLYFMKKLWLKGNVPVDKGGSDTEDGAFAIAEAIGVYR